MVFLTNFEMGKREFVKFWCYIAFLLSRFSNITPLKHDRIKIIVTNFFEFIRQKQLFIFV
jgi:hypothetical protein